MLRSTRVAIIHDQLYTVGGAEKVLKSICDLFPQADVFAMYNKLSDGELTGIMGQRRPKTSFIQRLPQADKLRRTYFPLMPLAVEQFNLSGYDLIISSSYLVAKGVIIGPNQTHLCYIHSPMRYAWDQQWSYLQSLDNWPKRTLAKLVLHYMRSWDVRSANGVDHFIANSEFVARRIEKTYRRSARVLYPPVDLTTYEAARSKEVERDRFVTMSRIAEGKRIDLLIEAFRTMPDLHLDIIGSGDLLPKLQAMAPANVAFLGRLSDEEAARRIARAAGFVYAAEEDFGISPVEAQAAGSPVVAYRSGGVTETVIGLRSGVSCPTGVFFEHQTPGEVAAAVRTLIQNRASFDPDACRQNAARFSEARFRRDFMKEVERALTEARWPRRREIGAFPEVA